MSEWSPPTLPRPWLAGIALLYVLLLGYLLVVLQQPLIGVVLGVFLASIYLVWRFLVALEAIAEAQQRLARREGQE